MAPASHLRADRGFRASIGPRPTRGWAPRVVRQAVSTSSATAPPKPACGPGPTPLKLLTAGAAGPRTRCANELDDKCAPLLLWERPRPRVRPAGWPASSAIICQWGSRHYFCLSTAPSLACRACGPASTASGGLECGESRDHGRLHLSSAPTPTSPSPYNGKRPPLEAGFFLLGQEVFSPRFSRWVCTCSTSALGSGDWFWCAGLCPLGRPGHQDRSLGPGMTVISTYRTDYGIRQLHIGPMMFALPTGECKRHWEIMQSALIERSACEVDSAWIVYSPLASLSAPVMRCRLLLPQRRKDTIKN